MEKRETKRASLKTIISAALLSALTCAGTLAIMVPSPTGGYMNSGDAVVLLSAYLLGPWWGAAAAGSGSLLADLMAGAAVYAPATLVIKAAMACLAACLYRGLGKKRWAVIPCGILAESVMVLGYWAYDALLLGSFSGAAAGLPSNLMQAVFGLCASSLLMAALRRSGLSNRISESF